MNTLRNRFRLLLIAAGVIIAGPAVRADVSMRINRVGPFTGSPFWVRDGVVTFVEVDVRNNGSAPFEGVLRTTQTDRDGDVVESELPIAVAPDREWEKKELYFIPNLQSGDANLTIKLYAPSGELLDFTNELGETINTIKSDAYLDSPDKDTHLVVTMMSGRRLPHESFLRPENQNLTFTEFVTGRATRSMAPRELPRKPQGLYAIDAIIWEDADPAEITSDQAEALIGWVKQGGRLLITVNVHWQSFENSPLAPIMPAAISDVEEVDAIPAFRDIVVTQSDYDEFARQYKRSPVTRCRMRPTADAIPIPTRIKPGEDAESDASHDLDPIAYRRFVGRGMVTLLGATLTDLMPPPPLKDYDNSDEENQRRHEFARIVENVVANNLLALPAFKEATQSFYGFDQKQNLFTYLTRTIGFSAVTGVFLFFAIGFTAIYTFVATLGSYLYLNKKGWASYCWSAFAAVSIVGVVIGLGMVWLLRGFSTKVWETSVVDARAGVNYGYATCLFGVKTKDHTRLDLQLPVGYAGDMSADGPLFALPKTFDAMIASETSFVASETYQLTQAATNIQGVPVRATLKEFEGDWHGELGGILEANLIFDESTKQFTDDSYIRNELGVTLTHCYLIEGDQEIAGEMGRAAGIRCHALTSLTAKGNGSGLNGETLVKTLYEKGPPNADGTPNLYTRADMRLSEFVDTWRRDIASIANNMFGQNTSNANIRSDVAHAPFMLLSVYNLIDPVGSGNATNWNLKRSFGRRLDCSHWITRNTAVLIGFSRDTPPALLAINRVNERPEKALTMYRFLIPVTRK